MSVMPDSIFLCVEWGRQSVPSVRETCGACGRSIAVSLAGIVFLEGEPNVVLMCAPCTLLEVVINGGGITP